MPELVTLNPAPCPNVTTALTGWEVMAKTELTIWVQVPLLPAREIEELSGQLAVMVWLPPDRPLVLKVVVATKPLPDNVPVPNMVVPCLKVTVPAGVPVPRLVVVRVTVTVNVTDWPELDGLGLLLTVVVEIS